MLGDVLSPLPARSRPSGAAGGVSLALPLDPAAAAEARRFVRQHTRVRGLDHQIEETAELLTSELVTNAVIHGRSSVSVTVCATPTQCLVEVGDDNPRLPLVLEPDEESLNGRGLAIVCGLADACGTYPHADGKVVWFQLHPPLHASERSPEHP